MTVARTELGFVGRRHPWENRPYFPSLAMLDTGEMFDQIPQKGPWQLPSPYHNSKDSTTRMLADGLQKGYQTQWDDLLGDWVRYLDHAEEGFNIAQRAAKEHIVSGDSNDLTAYLYFERSGIDVTLDNIHSVRRAFVALLSPKAREALKTKASKKGPTEQDIQNARTVVRNFEHTIDFLNFSLHEEED